MRAFLAVLVLVAFATVAGAWVPRPHVSLNGQWEVVKAPAAAPEPPAEGWRPVEVPGLTDGWRYEASWWRTSFDAPAEWQGKRVKMLLQGARFCPVLYVNGQKVGEHFGGYEPCEFDITSAVRPGEDNRVLLHCSDWTSLFKGDPVEFPETMDWDSLRGFPRDRVMYPIGGRYTNIGPWDDVVTYAVPEVHLQDVFVSTDVSKRELTVVCEVAKEGGDAATVEIAPAVMDGGTRVLALETQTVKLPAGKTTEKVTVTARWPAEGVTLWTPESPKLYSLDTRLRSPAGEDRRRERFGFRQFTVQGHKFLLNGVRRNLLATSTWPLGANTHDEVEEVLRRFKEANCVAFRTHTQPWQQIWYDVADEVGLLMIPEGAVWNDDYTYRLDDPGFWRNWGEHLVGMVRALRNHPSIVMWSIENEFFGGRAKAGMPCEKELGDLGRLVKRTDPTRPIMYESDGDPDGAADVVGVHYPHEPPGYRLWPQEAYWMDEPQALGNTRMFWPTAEFQWDKKKPLYIGEYLWWPSGTPASYTLIEGDEAYRSLDNARSQAKATVWRWQTVAYRHYEVSGICPWTLTEGGVLDLARNPMMAGQAYAMQPLAAYVREETRRAYSGQTVRRHLEVFNDTPSAVKATLRWALVVADKTLESGGMGVELGPGERHEQDVEFVAPAVQGLAEGVLRVTIEQGSRVLFNDERPFSVHGRVRLTKPASAVLLYDPPKDTAALLNQQGITTRPVADLAELKGEAGDVLVIGEGALASDELAERWKAWQASQALQAFVGQGGRVVVLQQDAYPVGVMPFRLDGKARSTMAFVQMPAHPVLEGLPDDAFKFWQPDHAVTGGELLRLAGAGILPLVVTGHPDGISHCALVEAARGKGLYLLCQMPLVERFAAEPMAAEMLNRLLKRAAEYDGEASEVLLAGGDETYRAVLSDMGVRYRDGSPTAEGLKGARVALLRGPASGDAAVLAQWVSEGGRLVLDRPAPELVTAIAAQKGLRLTIDSYPGPAGRCEGDHPLIQAIAREDLYWLGERAKGPSWAMQPQATDVTEGALSLDVDFQPTASFGPADMEIEGYIVRREPEQILMATVGAARAKFQADADGEYLVAVEARGSKCEDVYALGAVSVDGGRIGIVSTGEEWRRRTLPVTLEAGEHEVEVRFINDGSTPGEDRNFYLRAVQAGPVTGEVSQLVRIAEGPCVAALGLGQGQVVFNFLRWDTEENNARRARGFFASLLTAVGADFSDEFGVVFSTANFEPMEGLAHFKAEGGQAYMGSSGWIEGQVDVPATGEYLLRLEASGTPAANEYPEVVVFADGQEIGRTHLSSRDWRFYTFQANLDAGAHTVRLLFTNDYYEPPEDRNLGLRDLVIAPARQ